MHVLSKSCIVIFYLYLRYILVLYSDRGLVKKGEFYSLFNILYLVLVIVLSTWTFGLMGVYNFLSPEEFDKHELTSICLNNNVKVTFNQYKG